MQNWLLEHDYLGPLAFAATLSLLAMVILWLKEREITTLRNFIIYWLCLSAITGLPLVLVNYVTFRHPEQEYIDALNDTFFVPVFIVFAVFLYRLRGHHTMVYALMEISIGIGAVYYAVLSPSSYYAPKLLSLSGGIYIIIRGLDNMDKGLPAEYRQVWDYFFPKGRPPT